MCSMKNSYQSRARRVRRALTRHGMGLCMSPTRNRRAPDWGKFHVIDLETKQIVHGKDFNLNLEEVEDLIERMDGPEY
jgi:hypothetical protein